MYTDMYNTFDDVCIPYSYPFSFQGKNKLDYMENNNPPEYEMDYGDTAILPFKIDEEYQNHYINVIIYNFRYEEVYREQHIVEEDGVIRFMIGSELSTETFKRGVYYCRVQAEYKTDYEEDVCTLINPSDCVIRVR